MEKMNQTISEQYFEEYLKHRRIKWGYETFEGRSPDYLLNIPIQKIICEVKEIEDTEEIVRANQLEKTAREMLKTFKFPLFLHFKIADNFDFTDIKPISILIGLHKASFMNFKVGDKIIVAQDFVRENSKLVILEDPTQDGKRYYTVETISGKYPILDSLDAQSNFTRKFNIISDGSVHAEEYYKFSNFKEPLFEIEFISQESTGIFGPIKFSQVPSVEQVRRKIDKAADQIKPHREKKLPFALILFSKTTFGIDLEDLYQAMFGSLQITFYVPKKPGEKIADSGGFYGKDAMMKGKNTSFSSISLLKIHKENAFSLITVHNPAAKFPIGFKVFNGPLDRQFFVNTTTGQPTEHATLPE